ncbi:transposon protein [Striga asiatica]|uniref:Transposon protein n=1 Tax=Striga asiatica TaxID=4170 RepID=A0A5A7PJA8_STRAF|nr:transposon protein [Striga asiatica]
MDDPHKSKDTPNSRRDLMNMNIRPELHLYSDKGKIMKPRARYTLRPTKRIAFCNWNRSVRFPDGFASNLRRCVPPNEGRLTGLKSHDCHVIMQRLLPVAARAYLDKDISDAIIELCNFFKKMCAKSLNVSDLISAQSDVIMILCKLQRIFPPAFFDVMVHLVMHLPEEAILGGPEHLRWMFSTERYLKELKECVRNPAKPEGSIAEAYISKEAITFCARYFNDVETKFNRPQRNPICDVMAQLSVFRSQCIPIGGRMSVALDPEKHKHSQFYILNNCPEIDSFVQEHKQELMESGFTDLEFQHRQRFSDWFYKKWRRVLAVRLLRSVSQFGDFFLKHLFTYFCLFMPPNLIIESAQLTSPDTVVDERAIMREVFGTRRGHECGFGRILKGSKSSAIHDIPESSITSNTARKETQGATPNAESYANLLKETLARLKAKVGIDVDEEEETDAQFTHHENESEQC